MSDPSDPKWATDIANKKPLLSYSSLFKGANDFFDSGSATTSTSTTGSKRDTIYGHTNRIHLFTPGTFTGAISFVKNALSTLMLDGLVGVLWGGKNETITNSDSNKIIGSKKRVRVGYRFGNYQNWIGKAFSELWWKEERVTIGDRIDTIKGDIQTVVVNGEEKKIFNNTDKSTWRKIVLKSLGIPAQNWEGVTYSTINAATGYSFTTDKSYRVTVSGAQEDNANEIYFGASAKTYLQIVANDKVSIAEIKSDQFVVKNENSHEEISNSKSIKSKLMTVACDEALCLGVGHSIMQIKQGNFTIHGKTDLGTPTFDVIHNQSEYSRVELERLKQLECEQNEAMALFLVDLGV